VIGFAFAFLFAQLQPASVQGTVVQGDTGKPIPNAEIELSRTDNSVPQSYPAITAADGSFRITNIRPGEYRLTATRNGFVRTEYGQRRPGGLTKLLTLSAGQTMQGIQLLMTPAGLIAGRIYDRDGDPLGAANVQALKPVYQDGRRILQVVQSAVTNDLGEYRLFGLAPGVYFVSATPSDGQGPVTSITVAPRAANEPSAALLFGDQNLPVYFPGVADVRSASPVDLRTSPDRSGLDIIAPPIPMHHARGSIAAENGNVKVIPLSSTPGTSSANASAANGKFDIRGLVPGTYLLKATAFEMQGQTVIEVGDQDVENVSIPFTSESLIPGRLTFDDRPYKDDDPDAERVRFQLVTDPRFPGFDPVMYNPFPNGSFGLGLLPGDYRITSLQFEGHPNAYLKSVGVGGQDVFNDGLHVRGPINGGIEIVVGTKPGNLSGTALTERRQAGANALVVLIPSTGRGRWPDNVKTVVADAAGRFQIQSLPPGDYTAYAWNDIEPGAWQDPDFLRIYANRGTPVHIDEGRNQNAEVMVLQ
jgi:protocatechuate 3,4-dioxygenase beta subunit